MQTISILDLINLRKSAFINGLVFGTINVAILLFVFYCVPNVMTFYQFDLGMLLLNLSLGIYFCLAIRKKEGGYWTFNEALIGIFIVLMVASIITFYFRNFFWEIFDRSYLEKIREIRISSNIKIIEGMKDWGLLNSDQLSKLKKDATIRLENQNSVNLFIGLISLACVRFLMALILAAILKNRPASSKFITDNE